MTSTYNSLLASILLLAWTVSAHASISKLDPSLLRAWHQPEPQTVTARAVQNQPQLAALVQLHPEADAAAVERTLQSKGVQVRSRTGTVLSVRLQRSSLASVAGLTAIRRLEGVRPLPSRLFESVPATGASDLRTQTPPHWQGLTGRDVIVGIVDDGFDFLHPSLRHADDRTRILALWNQLDSAVGEPPSGMNYGGVCTEAMINQAIAQAEANTPITACTQPSDGGHGTHVASIAAGNGADTNPEQAYQHVGMAPEADLVLVNGIHPDINVDFGTDTVIDGIAFIRDQAKIHNKRAVINLSLGSYYGPRDGTSVFEQALDSFVTNDGLLIVAAAGNEGDTPIRTSGSIAPGASDTITLGVYPDLTNGMLEIWYSGHSRYSVALEGPDGCGRTDVLEAPVSEPLSEWRQETACGYIDMFSTNVNPDNGDRQIRITLSAGVQPTLASGRWQLTLTSAATDSDQSISQYNLITADYARNIEIVDREPADGITRAILTDTASATQVIGVASYNTNYVWEGQLGRYDIQEDGYGYGAVGDISSYSSRGPRRRCSDPTKCPNVMKPEITAPGTYIMAAKAGDYQHPYREDVSTSGQYVAFFGTSMATPHVAGALALLWQSFPEENAQQLRARVLGNTKITEYTPALLPRFTLGANQPEYPNYTWGYGVLDVYQAKNASEPEVTDPGAEEPETDAPNTQEPRRSGSGGCSLATGAVAFDPTLPLLLILAALAVLRPRRVKGVL